MSKYLYGDGETSPGHGYRGYGLGFGDGDGNGYGAGDYNEGIIGDGSGFGYGSGEYLTAPIYETGNGDGYETWGFGQGYGYSGSIPFNIFMIHFEEV